MRRTKRFASFALAACMGASLLANVPAGTVSAAEPTIGVVAEGTEESETVETGSEDATATDAGSSVAEETSLEQAEEVVADGAETSEADFEWDGTKITKYKANGADVVMPSRCTEIGDRAFQSKTELKTVEIPDGVKKIGECAFADCRLLKSIVIPDSVTTIGDEAFYYCALLEYAVIPDGVTTIGKRDENRE